MRAVRGRTHTMRIVRMWFDWSSDVKKAEDKAQWRPLRSRRRASSRNDRQWRSRVWRRLYDTSIRARSLRRVAYVCVASCRPCSVQACRKRCEGLKEVVWMGTSFTWPILTIWPRGASRLPTLFAYLLRKQWPRLYKGPTHRRDREIGLHDL